MLNSIRQASVILVATWAIATPFFTENKAIASQPLSVISVDISNSNTPDKSALDGTSWQLVSWGDPDSLNEPITDTEITLEFSRDGVSGSSGCNRYIAPFTVENNRLDIGIAAGTLMACPEEIMDQEFQFLTALEGGEEYAIEDGQLVVNYTTDEGSGVLIFESGVSTTQPPSVMSEQSLAGTSWKLVSWGDPDFPDALAADAEITLVFDEDRIGGSSGCNRYMAPYTAENSRLEIGIPAGTRMACPEAIMSREFQFLKALEGVQNYAIADNQLTLDYTTSEDSGVLIFESEETAE